MSNALIASFNAGNANSSFSSHSSLIFCASVAALFARSVSASTFLLAYSLVKSGIDFSKLLEWLEIPVPEWSESTGTLLLAFTMYKLLMPVRLMVSVGLTPPVMRYLKKMKWIQ